MPKPAPFQVTGVPPKRWLAGVVLVLGLTFAGATASAQTPLDDGTRLMQQGRYQDALGYLLPAWATDASSRLAYAIARCYDGLNEPGLAIKFYNSAVKMKPRLSRSERSHARNRVKILKRRPQTRTEKATLYLEATAIGALVLLNGQEIGRTPLAGILIPPGNHRLSIIHDGFERWDRDFTASPRESVQLKAEMVDKPTDVLVHTEPAGAVARLSDGTECITPCLMALRAGTYQMSLQKQGFAPLFHKFTKNPGQMAEVRLRLQPGSGVVAQPTNQTGLIAVTADHDGAQVYLDGALQGTTPLPGPLQVPVGQHIVQVQLNGFFPWTGRVNVGLGQTTPVSVRMRPATAPSQVAPGNVVSDGSAGKAPWQHPTGWGLIGSGIGLAVGGALAVALPTILNKRKLDLATRFQIDDVQYIVEYTRGDALELEQQAQTWATVGYVGIGVGTALIITGAVILGIDAGEPTPSGFGAPGVSVTPLLAPDLFGASAELRF